MSDSEPSDWLRDCLTAIATGVDLAGRTRQDWIHTLVGNPTAATSQEGLKSREQNLVLGLLEDLRLHQPASVTAAPTAALTADEWYEKQASLEISGDWAGILQLMRLPEMPLTSDDAQQWRAACWRSMGWSTVAGLFGANPEGISALPISAPKAPKFHVDQSVIWKQCQLIGTVLKEPELSAGEYWYELRFDHQIKELVESELEECDETAASLQTLVEKGKWGPLNAFRCALACERLTHKNRNTVYSFQSQRILFQPHQYKPLLRVLDSPDRRILIADEVGLGKTIEAGLILTELIARMSLQRILVVCPSRLCSKWQQELESKFDIELEIHTQQTFLEAVDRVADRPHRHFRAIASMQMLRSEEMRQHLRSNLAQLDFVIVDEAHHARNPSTATSKLLRALCEISRVVVLLTATPIHLRNLDLFTQLHALRPTEFREPHGFDAMLNRHAAIHEAGTLVRLRDRSRLQEVLRILTVVFPPGTPNKPRDPQAELVMTSLTERQPASLSDWIELERHIAELHPLGSILTRNLKRDVIQDAPVRRAETLRCEWTPREFDAYHKFVAAAGQQGWFWQKLSLGQITRARQAASCLPAALHNPGSPSDISDPESCDIDLDELGVETKNFRATVTHVKRSSLSQPALETDSKFAEMWKALQRIWQTNPQEKVLIFTFFRGTAEYLEQRLIKTGISALRIDGSVQSKPRNPSQDERGQRMRRFREDPNALVLVSTEVGSEGLDFQFCSHLVNYDLPWNPMVLEQRIGRIDRFGQGNKVVNILNMVVRGSVEDRILDRLYSRIGIFERSLGRLEAILGETASKLTKAFIDGELTAEEAERRLQESVEAIERREHDLAELANEATELFGHEDYLHDELDRVRKLGRYITETTIVALLKTYLESRHPGAGFEAVHGQPHVYRLRLTSEIRSAIHNASKGDGGSFVRTQNDNLTFTTVGEIAYRNPDLELINVTHPLLKAAIDGLKQRMNSARARTGQAQVVLKATDCGGLQAGLYWIAVISHEVLGIRERNVMEPIVLRACDGTFLDDEAGERLLFLTLEFGQDCDSAYQAPPLSPIHWKEIDSEKRRRNRRLSKTEERESEVHYLRRRNALEAEHNLVIEHRTQRLHTATENREASSCEMFKGQIEKAEARFQARLAELEKKRICSVPLGDVLAVCAVLLEIVD
jgi:SNF2 family DNA or RNA helicase